MFSKLKSEEMNLKSRAYSDIYHLFSLLTMTFEFLNKYGSEKLKFFF
jgi:hypothetical protein